MTAPKFKPTIDITNIKSGGLYRGELGMFLWVVSTLGGATSGCHTIRCADNLLLHSRSVGVANCATSDL